MYVFSGAEAPPPAWFNLCPPCAVADAGLYRGFGLTAIRDVPSYGIYFYLYHQIASVLAPGVHADQAPGYVQVGVGFVYSIYMGGHAAICKRCLRVGVDLNHKLGVTACGQG